MPRMKDDEIRFRRTAAENPQADLATLCRLAKVPTRRGQAIFRRLDLRGRPLPPERTAPNTAASPAPHQPEETLDVEDVQGQPGAELDDRAGRADDRDGALGDV